jgi:RNA polymerase sigma-70 factor (ECF subfamily)
MPSRRSRASLDELARGAKRGDANATAELCGRCRPPILIYMRSVLRDSYDAEEATQHVMLSVLEGLPHYRLEGTPFKAWAFAIAHNYAVDFRRRRGRSIATDPAEVDRVHELDEVQLEGRDERSALQELIRPLGRAQRQVLTLLYEHDLSPEQAARVLGRTAASVRQEHKRAREKLRSVVYDEAERMYPERLPGRAPPRAAFVRPRSAR